MPTIESRGRGRGAIALAGLVLACLAGLLLLMAGPGSRLDWWHFSTGFTLLQYAAYGGLAAAVISAIGLFVARGRVRGTIYALVGLVLGLGVAAIPWSWRRTARSVPPIHDITTDTENPPAFVAILPLRADAPNPAEYGGPEIAEQQRTAYPDIRPLVLDIPPAAAFDRAVEAARELDWEIVVADSAAGRIEASDRTRWFGFVDDIVVRITPTPSGSRVDVRSVSRVGRSDVGMNARRIETFLDRMRS